MTEILKRKGFAAAPPGVPAHVQYAVRVPYRSAVYQIVLSTLWEGGRIPFRSRRVPLHIIACNKCHCPSRLPELASVLPWLAA